MINITMDLEDAIRRAYKAARCNFSAPWSVITRLYSYSTEITEDYLENFDFKETRIITVGSSGDQVLTYALAGSKDITIMDANPLTPFFINLKIAAVKTLSMEEFSSFFKQENSREFMSFKTYAKIRENLDDKTKVFWDKLYDDEIQDKIFHFYTSAKEDSKPPFLASKENYEKLKSQIDDVEINFHYADLSTFHENAEGEYELIDLSNIYTYVSKEKYWNAVNHLHKHLTKNGYIKLHYCSPNELDDFTYLNKPSFTVAIKDIKENAFIIWQNDEYLYEQNHPNKTY